MRKAEIQGKFDAIVAFAEVERFLDTPVKRYSTGMYLRLAFSVAAHLEPEILLVDEVLAVGDVSFQRKCLDKMEEVGKAGRTVLFVSHNVPSVMRLCDRVVLLERGVVAADGRPHEVVARYLSPKTGSPAERVWPDIDQAPGNAVARMKAVRVLDEFGAIAEAVDVGDPLFLEIEYWQLRQSGQPVAAFQLFNEEGVCLFASSAFQSLAESEQAVCPRIVRARCRIPAHLLGEGRVFMLAAVVSYNPEVAHALERDAVSFQVVDRRGADVVREHYAGQWPGAVRPKLDWDIEAEQWR
jgi:lipopolysaccharide transport system ATP-binding protein